MRRSILAVVLIAVVAAASMTAFTQSNSQQNNQQKKAEQAKDPVCGLTVDKNPELSHNHKGETFYFCSKADMEKFKKEPDKYPKKK